MKIKLYYYFEFKFSRTLNKNRIFDSYSEGQFKSYSFLKSTYLRFITAIPHLLISHKAAIYFSHHGWGCYSTATDSIAARPCSSRCCRYSLLQLLHCSYSLMHGHACSPNHQSIAYQLDAANLIFLYFLHCESSWHSWVRLSFFLLGNLPMLIGT